MEIYYIEENINVNLLNYSTVGVYFIHYNGNKIIITGRWGMIVSNDEELLDRAKLSISQHRPKITE